MRVREFRTAMADLFGERADALLQDLVLGELGSRSAAEALAAGTPPQEVWVAMCRACDVPQSRWHGAGLREPTDR